MSTDPATARRGAFPEKKCSGRAPVGALRLAESSVPPLLLAVPTPELGRRRGTELAEDALDGARHGFCAETAVPVLHGGGKSRVAIGNCPGRDRRCRRDRVECALGTPAGHCLRIRRGGSQRPPRG